MSACQCGRTQDSPGLYPCNACQAEEADDLERHRVGDADRLYYEEMEAKYAEHLREQAAMDKPPKETT